MLAIVFSFCIIFVLIQVLAVAKALDLLSIHSYWEFLTQFIYTDLYICIRMYLPQL